jgi:hypothetical protein
MLDEPRGSQDVKVNYYSLDSEKEALDEQKQDELYGEHEGGNRK